MNDETTLEQIYERHRSMLKNLGLPNPKLIVAFSGIPGAGVSTIARQIEDHYQGVRFSHDEVRRLLEEVMPGIKTPDREEWLLKYDEFFYRRAAKGSNGLIIHDASVDRKYDLLKGWADDLGFKLFVISVQVPLETAKQRIQEREGEAAASYMPHFERWVQENQKFNAAHQPDYLVDNAFWSDPSGLYAKLDVLLDK